MLDLKPLRSLVKGKHSIGREFQSLVVRESDVHIAKMLSLLWECEILTLFLISMGKKMASKTRFQPIMRF